MPAVNDFSESETQAIETTLNERWPGQDLDIQLADVEIKLDPDDREFSEVPAIFWLVDEANFVIAKTGERSYRCQFYHRGYQQHGAGNTEFDNIADCLVTLLQVHADKETMLREERAGKK